MLRLSFSEGETTLEKQIALTPFERLSLMNQLLILKRLDPDNAKDYDDQITILHSGYTIRYGEVFQPVFEEMPIEECEYVYDVLDMHRILITSFESLTDKQGLTADDVRFRGFDGNCPDGVRPEAFVEVEVAPLPCERDEVLAALPASKRL
jgi:uncharacterized protein YfbU (UPF0304 family)